MRPASVGLIHTVPNLVPLFGRLIREMLPGVKTFDLVDGTLLPRIRREGRVATDVAARVMSHIAAAEAEGADAVLVTCSSIGPVVDAAASFCARPVLRVDEAMADAAVAGGRRIGVLATLQSTLEPTTQLIERKAAAKGLDVHVKARVVDEAFAALGRGDEPRHDALVGQQLVRLAREVDTLVLAQASMARVLLTMEPDELAIDVLSSPELAVKRLKEHLVHSEVWRPVPK